MRLKALKAAFPSTLPILAGFGFLGTAYGIYMNISGFNFWYPFLMSLIVYGGSLQFVAVTLLLAPFAPLQTFIMALIIQARHLFYGIAMLEKYKDMGWKKFYLIYCLSDETFSINCSAKIPDGIDRGWFYFFVTLLDQIYWVGASLFGGIVGSLLTFDTTGLEFVLTAMFVVIFFDQWLNDKKHFSSIVGLIATLICRLGFGADNFLIPSMICILFVLTVFKRPSNRTGGYIL